MTFVKHTGLIVCFSKLSQNIEQATIKTYCCESLAQRFLHVVVEPLTVVYTGSD